MNLIAKLSAKALFAVLTAFFLAGFTLVDAAGEFGTQNVSRNISAAKNFSGDERRIHDLVNDERHRKRLNDLEWNEDLARLARNYARQMARDSFFDHFDLNGDSVVERAQNFKIRNWSKIGENLFFCEGYREFANLTVRGWMRSPTHRANILDREWTTTGIGVARTGDGRVYVTQVFIKR